MSLKTYLILQINIKTNKTGIAGYASLIKAIEVKLPLTEASLMKLEVFEDDWNDMFIFKLHLLSDFDRFTLCDENLKCSNENGKKIINIRMFFSLFNLFLVKILPNDFKLFLEKRKMWWCQIRTIDLINSITTFSFDKTIELINSITYQTLSPSTNHKRKAGHKSHQRNNSFECWSASILCKNKWFHSCNNHIECKRIY